METTTAKKPAWTEEQEARIAHFQETLGFDRAAAIRKMRTEEKAAKPAEVVTTAQLAEQQGALDAGINTELTGTPEPTAKPARKAHAKSAPKPKAQAKPRRKAGESAEAHLSPQKLAAISAKVREAIGKGRAVEALFKSSLSDKYTKYLWYGLDNGTVISINPDTMETRFLDESSRSVKNWQKAQRAALKREEKAAKKAEAK